MNKILHIVDRYKFGIIAAFAAYIGIFMYLQMETYEQYFPIQPFYDEPIVVIEENQLEIDPETIEMLSNQKAGEVKNMSRDVNDTRERSNDKYFENKSASQVEQSVKDYEKSLFAETGGEGQRQSIRKEMEERKTQKSNSNASSSASKSNSSQTGGDKAFAGNVMVDWSLSGRNPHQNNNYYVRNPGYTCGHGSSGSVSIQIQVNQNGDVVSAVPTSTSGANGCMIEQAVKYAKLSRFNYSGSSPKSQEGTITYTFVSQ